MHHVSIQLDVNYVKCDLAPEQVEWDPELCVYLTGHFKRQMSRVPLELNKSMTCHVQGTRAAELGDIPSSAAIVFMGIAKHRNDAGVPCRIDAGTSHIMLSELQQHNWTRDGPFVKDVHLLMHTANNFDKGTVRITVHETNHIQLAGLKISAKPIGDEAVAKRVIDYLKENMHMCNEMGNTLPGTQNVQCPFDFSQAARQAIGIPIPAENYVLNPECPESNALFWDNAFENVMKRDGYKPQDWHRLTPNQRARIAIQLVAYPVQYMPYIGDKIDQNRRGRTYRMSLKRGMEDFGDALLVWAGDCEDLAKAIMQVMGALKAYDVKKSDSRYRETFVQMKALMEQFIPQMSLEVVHGAQASDHTESYGAHMSDVIFPAYYHKECLERTAEGRELAKRLPYPKVMDRTLELELGEGTAILEPYGGRDRLANARAYVAQSPVVQSLKRDIITPHGAPSPFFVSAKQGWTPYFALRGAMDGEGVGFYYTHEPEGTRGALYTDFTNERDNVGLRPMLRMPEDVQALCREAVMFRPPPDALILSKQRVHVQSHLLDHVVDAVDQAASERGHDERPSVAVPVYIAPHQLEKHMADALANELTQLDRVWKVEYVCEHVTDHIHGWRVLLHVHVDQLVTPSQTSHT